MSTDLLGHGLLRPFRRDQKSDFANSGGAELVAACVGQILGTERDAGAAAGELPWDDEMGSRLHLLRHRNNDQTTQELARVYVSEALAQEPRARLTGVSVEEQAEPRVLIVKATFDAIVKNSAGNDVIVQGLEAVVSLG
jgi:phage baseplate assembly protein W